MYGKEDPWVRPVWGLQVKRQVPEAPYYEISPAGHCPHDEVPEVMLPYLIIKLHISYGCLHAGWEGILGKKKKKAYFCFVPFG